MNQTLTPTMRFVCDSDDSLFFQYNTMCVQDDPHNCDHTAEFDLGFLRGYRVGWPERTILVVFDWGTVEIRFSNAAAECDQWAGGMPIVAAIDQFAATLKLRNDQ